MLPEVCDHLLNACRNRLCVGWRSLSNMRMEQG